ncbi:MULTISPECIES: CRISPR-associated helicase/endonuclease Cas3 [Paenibacillus]|uniref:Metal dependent phosphohydrolase n=2 Tax=Paenibacillus lactis TaxID=228574 RepID=G4HKC0_9BACL|nr:CRISPR-associated helicase/endonuclease Cas3 [Paenibacillus lactis]EHB62321.1 metal dependent phosphohydrolase [Paenibacillus lactis 154]MBP1895671.1 CRISPR-associated endonuclease/helicase Cas3 [Paenibacillus lactis]MCM3495978.1 CRISPR-associated helicase/endonuclease Cas3 [Paenibacillus lactis]HAF99999.1 CRISPR-associated helicase/endonuclease Cas3 [Paenibacillus lactis]
MTYIAHIRQSDGKIQTVDEHLREVKELSERHGAKIGAAHLAGLAGLLHDMGKYTTEFKNYIEEAVAHPEAPPRKGSVDHSTAGGRLVYERYHRTASTAIDKFAAEWIANCVISHHQGLRDFVEPNASSPFLERVEKKALNEYEQAKQRFFEAVAEEEIDACFEGAKKELARYLSKIKERKLLPIAASLLLKYIFSCLIDADRTNTRRFDENEEPEEPLNRQAFFARSYKSLLCKLQVLEQGMDSDHPINRLRREMSQRCDEFAERASGIYTLSIPTGGGKTLASLRYALKHARIHGKDRIIYVVPYTTIIEQNAAEIREILQEDEWILEHHSNVIEHEDDLETEDYDVHRKKIRNARDSWDSPIIFTTMVQFLNTFYAKGTRNVRRLHRLSNAVIIFDEVQSVPVNCISIFNAALNFLNILGRSSLLLCTATQPALDFVKHKLHISKEAEIIEDLEQVADNFKRVELVSAVTPLGWGAEELTDFVRSRLDEIRSVLVILNTKTAVRKLYDQLSQSEWMKERGVKLFHLSTNMCAAHRKEVLSKVIDSLEAQEPVICVSTQLIEAGVNISFDCVIRSLAGLDSIAQAAGRCNRHGKAPIRKVYIIKSADEKLTSLPEIRIGAEKTERVLRDFEQNPARFGSDLLSPAAMKTYFSYYYKHVQGEMDFPILRLGRNMFDLLSANKAYVDNYKYKHGKHLESVNRASFATAELYFEAISNTATSVVVPYNEEAESLIAALNGKVDAGELGSLFRRLQPYIVNVYDQDLKKLDNIGYVQHLLQGHVLTLLKPAYSDEFGVDAEGEGAWDEAIL